MRTLSEAHRLHVREAELPPRVVLDLWKQHAELRDLSRPGCPSVSDRVGALERRLDDFAQALDEQTLRGTLPTEVSSLRHDLAALREAVSSLPLPPRGQFTCNGCGATGWIAAHAQCTACGREEYLGFHPE